ncbi:hypothetical protein J6K35_02250 [bacterium]|nr:hypothetical protein [bacterium]
MIAFCTFMVMKEIDDARSSDKKDPKWEECQKLMNDISVLQKEHSRILDKLVDI